MKTILVITIYLVVSSVFSQQAWVQTYNGTSAGSDYGTDVAVDNSGNIYVCGATFVQGSNNESILIKYSPAGVKLWEQIVGTPNNTMAEFATCLALDNQGNIYMAGCHYTGAWPSAFVIKYNNAGIYQWIRVHDRIQYDDTFNALAVDDTGNVYLTGFSEEPGAGYDIVVAKYAPNSTTKWVSYYNAFVNRYDRGQDIKLDASGNIYVAGYQGDSLLFDASNAVLLKYNNAGTLLWKAKYKGDIASGLNSYESLVIDNNGNVYTGGFTTQTTTNNGDVLFAKYSPDGTRQWLKTQHGNTGDVVYDIKTDNSYIYITGSLGPDILTAKYDLAGNQQWQKFYNGPANLGDQGYELALSSGGDVYSAGFTLPSNFLSDAVIVKYNSAGDQQWANVYSGATNRFDGFSGVAIDPAGDVIAAGQCEIHTGSLSPDILVIKYNPVIGITPIGNSVPIEFSLSQNYPNPFNPVTNVEFAVPKSSFVKMTVFDVLGKEIAILVNENLKAGAYKADWNASKYPSGVYFYKLTSENYSETKKMILIK